MLNERNWTSLIQCWSYLSTQLALKSCSKGPDWALLWLTHNQTLLTKEGPEPIISTGKSARSARPSSPKDDNVNIQCAKTTYWTWTMTSGAEWRQTERLSLDCTLHWTVHCSAVQRQVWGYIIGHCIVVDGPKCPLGFQAGIAENVSLSLSWGRSWKLIFHFLDPYFRTVVFEELWTAINPKLLELMTTFQRWEQGLSIR